MHFAQIFELYLFKIKCKFSWKCQSRNFSKNSSTHRDYLTWRNWYLIVDSFFFVQKALRVVMYAVNININKEHVEGKLRNKVQWGDSCSLEIKSYLSHEFYTLVRWVIIVKCKHIMLTFNTNYGSNKLSCKLYENIFLIKNTSAWYN